MKGVFVVGMHRSGTSAAARLVNLLGIPTCVEEDLLLKTEDNPRGYWESATLTGLNDRLGGPPTSLDPSEAEWLRDKFENAGGRRTVLLSHHQLFSTNEQFDGKSYNANLYSQLEPMIPGVDLWLWGHEHDLVVFGSHMNLSRGRCIGGSAFPVGKYEVPEEILIKLRYANRFRRVIVNTIALAIGKPAIDSAAKYEDAEEMAAFMRLIAEWNGGTCMDIRKPFLDLK